MKERLEKVTDPVCGMRFEAEKALAQAPYGDKTYLFCTEACRKQFDADPERYVEPRGGPRH